MARQFHRETRRRKARTGRRHVSKIASELLIYDGQVLEAFEFWEQHAFSNLVPRLMDDGAERPTTDDWRAARKEFPLILEAVQPKRILIASARAVEELKLMSDTASYLRVGADDCWEMRFGGVPVIGIYHPSSWNRMAYNLERARGATARLRSMSN